MLVGDYADSSYVSFICIPRHFEVFITEMLISIFLILVSGAFMISVLL